MHLGVRMPGPSRLHPEAARQRVCVCVCDVPQCAGVSCVCLHVHESVSRVPECARVCILPSLSSQPSRSGLKKV